ncbi:MAG TPA: 2-C-methyl-D-erythritol 4-phosphate cytidylyltransferase [bacterium]|nr:2-C-methyl-D-erythritol 4-phosphate cytidylyltransferase [bacterium]
MAPSQSPRIAVLIPAAGSGQRVGAPTNKLLLPLFGTAVIVHTVRAFQAHPSITSIGVITRATDQPGLQRCFGAGTARYRLLPWITGGAQRQDSVYNGLAALAHDPPDWVLVHDGARPCCSTALIERVIAALDAAPGVVPVLPMTDTVRRIAASHSEVLPREHLYRTQTPQGFHWDALWEAHQAARKAGLEATDDAQLLEARGVEVAFVEGDPENVKITTPQDLGYAEWLLHRKS